MGLTNRPLGRLSLRHRLYQQFVTAESAPAYVEHRGNPAQVQVLVFDWQDKKEPLLAKCLRGQVPERFDGNPSWGRKRRTGKAGSLASHSAGCERYGRSFAKTSPSLTTPVSMCPRRILASRP